MIRRPPGAVILAVTLLLTGCSTAPPLQAPTPMTAPPATESAIPATGATPSVSVTTPTAKPTPTPKATPSAPAADKRAGRQLRTPYVVNGIPVVSKKHRITASYGPKPPTGPYRLEAGAAAALTRMTAAARADSVRVRVRSGYRNWASQNASYQRAKRNYPQNLSFYAPAGASEHQTGLAVDLWDGVTWSLPMARTATGKWLFRHAHEYGFVLRYPDGKAKITGYHYEPWHYRYIGKDDAMEFKSNSLTLEEYLGLA